VQTSQYRAGEDLDRICKLGQDFSGWLWASVTDEGDELDGTLIEGTLIEGTLTVGAAIEGTLMVGGVCFESVIERLSIDGIRSSSRGSGLPWLDFGAAGKGLTTPVLQKSFLFAGLELLSCGYGMSSLLFSSRRSSWLLFPLPILQPVEFSDFPGTGGKALFVEESLPPFETPTSTYPAVVLPLP
jgi:hypothetical protein